VADLLERCRPEADSLVVLPEMFDTGFSMRAPELAREYSGQSESFLRQFATDWKVGVMAGVTAAGSEGKASNEAVVFSRHGELLMRYSKTFPFRPGGEADFFEAGSGPKVFSWGGVRVAPFVCYDLRFPEIQRRAVQLGAEVMVFIASWPSPRAAHWTKLLQARAIENQCFVLGVNRIGSDPQHGYSGGSLLVNPAGEIVSDAGDSENVLAARLDLGAMRQYRERLPFLADLRPEFLPGPLPGTS
jgi:predicted amidohydrolase